MLILIVEDEDERANDLQNFWKSKMTKTVRAHDGFEALVFLKSNKPDLIMSDINMPGMDGYRLIKRVKENDATKSIPFFAYSQRPLSEENRDQAIELGADYCLNNVEVERMGNEALTAYAAL